MQFGTMWRHRHSFCTSYAQNIPYFFHSSRRKRDITTSVYVFKPGDVHFLPGFPKYGRNGTVEARFFVAISQSSGSGTNTTKSLFTSQPMPIQIINVNTIVKAVKSSKDVFEQEFGIEIESVKVVQVIEKKKPKNGIDLKKLLIIIGICLAALLGLVVILGICIKRRRNR